MPYRLRIKFAAQQFLRLPALFGQFSSTGKDAVLRETTTQQPSADEWELISGGYSGNDTRAGPEQPFHHDAEFIDSTGDGILATFSCSQLVDAASFTMAVSWAGVDAGRDVQILRPPVK